jgi:hypothetical protein
MKGTEIVNALGFVTGAVFMLLGIVLSIGGSLITATLDTALQESSRGLRAAGDAINTATDGVAGSRGMVEEVRRSLENTSCIVTGTGDVIQHTVSILEEMRFILPVLANDMASMPPMVRNMMPSNHFDEVAERTETVSAEIGFLNSRLEDLSEDVTVAGESIGDVALSVEAMEDDLLSAEGSFSDAAGKMEEIAASLEGESYATFVAMFTVGFGVLMFLAGVYQISSGLIIRKLVKGQAEK